MRTKDCKRRIDRNAIRLLGVSQSYLNSHFKAEKTKIEYEIWVKNTLEEVEEFEKELEIITSSFKAKSVFTKGKCDGGYKISIMISF